jgi:hypothetical protein
MLIFAASLAVFVYGMVASMLGTINPALATRFGLTNVQTSYIALAQGIGLVIASVSVGPLLDRKGKKVGLLLGLAFVASALFVLANAAGYSAMVFSMAVLGLGGGITITAANALGSDVSESKRAVVLNFLNVFVGLGGLVTPFVAGNLLEGDAVRVAYGGAILTTAAFLIQIVTKVPPPKEAPKAQDTADVFRERLLYPLALTVLLLPDGAGHTGDDCVEYPLARVCARTPAWPRGGCADPDSNRSADRDDGSSRAHGDHDLRSASNVRKLDRGTAGFLHRPRDGAGVPDFDRHGGEPVQTGRGDRDRLHHHLRIYRSRHQLPDHRLALRERSAGTRPGAVGATCLLDGDGRSLPVASGSTGAARRGDQGLKSSVPVS